MSQKRSHEQFLKDLWKKNKHYQKGLFWVVGVYTYEKTKILIRDKYGELLISPHSLLKGQKPTIRSAVDKTSYFKNMVLEKNKHYKNGTFWIVGDYVNMTKKILCEDKYGKSTILSSDLLRGRKPNIQSAINQTEYLINKFKEIWGDRYGYEKVDYQGMYVDVDIYCKVHKKYFPQLPYNHLWNKGCKKCADIATGNYQKENPTGGWTDTKWEETAKDSPNFKAFECYVIRVYNKKEYFFKIGKTYATLKGRFPCQECNSAMPYKFEVLHTIVGTAKEISKLERELKKLHKQYKYTPLKEFTGMHECFSFIDEKIVKEKFGGLKN